jgi:hypothetical protein
MTLPLDDRAAGAMQPLQVSVLSVGRRRWLRNRWPAATVVLGALFTLIWLGALTLLFALRF